MICDKVEYDSHHEAMRQAGHMRRKCSKRHNYSAYRCKFCDKWHLTTTTKLRPISKRLGKYPFRYEKPVTEDFKNRKRKGNGRK